jgi:pyruvate/2-oxoglutarate dehydrogenase complex dihydrolipoamide acyltransferase (E2) component
MPVHSTTLKHRHPPPRRSRHFRPAALIILGFATLGCSDPAGIAAQPAPAPTTVSTAAPAAATTAPPATTAAPTTTPKVEVPRLVGMKLASARQRLASHGLKLRVRYRPTARFAAGTVISQSRRMGVGVARSSAITLVIAKALPPQPPSTQPPPPPTTPSRSCHPSYEGACLDPTASDYDCAGGSGNGPRYVQGPVKVRPPDPFDLDADNDGLGCEPY